MPPKSKRARLLAAALLAGYAFPAAAQPAPVPATPAQQAVARGRALLEQANQNGASAQQALRAFDEAIALAPSDPQVTAWRGAAWAGAAGAAAARRDYLSALRITKRALGLLDQAVQRAPDDPTVRLIRAMTTRELPGAFKRKRQSLDDLLAVRSLLGSQGLTRWPQEEQARFLLALGDAHAADGNQEAARTAWKEATSLPSRLPAASTARRHLDRAR